MTNDEKQLYLTNAVAIAHADSKLTPAEEALLDSIRTSIGATKTIFKKAQKSALAHSIHLDGLGRFSLRVRNLEDMIEVALADGGIDEIEKSQLIDASKNVGISQEQVNLILAEAKERQKSVSIRCPSCGEPLDAGSKFCSNCGNPIGSVTASKQVDLAIPPIGVTVAFAESTSVSFDEALRLAKTSPTFQQAERSGKKWFCLTSSRDDMDLLLSVVGAVSSLKNKEAYVDGRLVDWRDSFDFAWCYKERAEAYNSTNYCFGLEGNKLNVWGCKRINLDWSDWGDLFTYGSFVNDKTFQFDLDRISHALSRRMKDVELCPCLQVTFIQAAFKYFPKTAKIGKDWEYRHSYDTDPNAIKITVRHEYGTETYEVNGVKPTDASLAWKIINAAADDCGIYVQS